MNTSLLKRRAVHIVREGGAIISGAVREASVGEYVSFATSILKFLDLADIAGATEGKSETDIIEILSDLVVQSPETLAMITSMCELNYEDGEDGRIVIYFNEMPVDIAKLILIEVKEANADFLSAILSQVSAMSKTQDQQESSPKST